MLDEAEPPEDSAALGADADPESVARTILLDKLTGRPRSRAELETALARRRVPADVAGRLLDRFEDVGLVDDAAFAREWVQTRQAHRGLARRALAQELRRKGVDPAVAQEAVDEVDPADEIEAARDLVRRRLPALARFDEPTVVRRLIGLLARKGYSGGIAYQVVREEVAGAEELLHGDGLS
jgi:regulatory protein